MDSIEEKEDQAHHVLDIIAAVKGCDHIAKSIKIDGNSDPLDKLFFRFKWIPEERLNEIRETLRSSLLHELELYSADIYKKAESVQIIIPSKDQ